MPFSSWGVYAAVAAAVNENEIEIQFHFSRCAAAACPNEGRIGTSMHRGLALLLLLLATGPRTFPEERLLLDRRLETLRRILPDGANPAQDAIVVRELAEAAHFSELSVTPKAPLELPNRGTVLVEVAAVAGFADVDRFFRQIALSPRLIDVESVA